MPPPPPILALRRIEPKATGQGGREIKKGICMMMRSRRDEAIWQDLKLC